MLLVLGIVLAGVLLWLAVFRPLSLAEERARDRLDTAVLALAEARARALGAVSVPGRVATGPINAIVSSTAAAAGFGTANVVPLGPHRASVTIPAARPAALFAWINRLSAQGVEVERLLVRPNPDQTVTVDAGFQGRAG